MSKIWSAPPATTTAPEGAIEPPAPALAVIVKFAGSPASDGVPTAVVIATRAASVAHAPRGACRHPRPAGARSAGDDGVRGLADMVREGAGEARMAAPRG